MAVLLPLRGVAGQGRISGVVRDSSGAGIVGAQIAVEGTSLVAQSGEQGEFSLARVPAGTVTLRVRRLGFSPASLAVNVPPSSGSDAGAPRVTLVIHEIARGLAPVLVRAEARRRYTGYLAGFYERREQGFGRFIAADQIERRNPLRLTDMLRTIPGLNVSTPSIGDSHVRLRGSRCAPLVWLDGMPAAAAEFDLDALPPQSIAGIEIYSGPATAPPEFRIAFGPTACGTIVIWSRQGEPRVRRSITAAELASLVASLRVYTADQVDRAAQPDSTSPVRPVYPESVFREAAGGRVVAEFVVDSAGAPDMSTFGVVSSSDPRLTDAVRLAVAQARFHPAMLAGRSVPQVVREPFAFTPPARP